MTQTEEWREQARQPETPADYFVIESSSVAWYVSRGMAQAVEATLTQSPPPQWVVFVDLTGARVRLRTRLLEVICQCTADQRALARAFSRARRAERKAEPDWDEE
jgi:hypothetical protein